MSFKIIENYCVEDEALTFSFNAVSPKCNCCSTTTIDDCCETNEFQIVKIKDQYFPSQKINIKAIDISSFILPFIQNSNLYYSENPIKSSTTHLFKPPDKSVSRSILFRSILI